MIAVDLGFDASKYKTASELERAIAKRLDKTDVVYGGKPTLTKAERIEVDNKFVWWSLAGAKESEQKHLSELATDEFGQGKPGRRHIKDIGSQMPEADTANYRATQDSGMRSYKTR